MTRDQVDSTNGRIKNPWLGVEVQFNDMGFELEHMEPNNEHCRMLWIQPSAPVHLGVAAHSWDTLKTQWGEVRKAVTLVHKNYIKSGSMDTQDTSDVYDFCGGNAWLCYIYMAALRRSNPMTPWRSLQRPWATASTARTGSAERRGSLRGAALEPARGRPREGEAGLHRATSWRRWLKLWTASLLLLRPPLADALAAKKLDIELQWKSKEEDRFAALLSNPNCLPELKAKRGAHFMKSLADMD